MKAKPTSAHFDELRTWLAAALRAQAQKKAPELPPDFALWIGHLFWLQASIEAHTLLPSQLRGDEAQGLIILAEVTKEVCEGLVRCPHCGAFTERRYSTCSACGRPLGGKA